MINAEAEELFRIVISGTRVTIQGEIRPNEAPIVR
jgi:lipoprotein-anchoring transpeptidase ErfK/SrfK